MFYDIDEEYAETFFWEQVLSGDSTDSIQGCYGIGAGKAKKLVAEWYDDLNDEGRTRVGQQFWPCVLATYSETMDTHPSKYPEGMKPEEAALETARLVHMLHYENQLWVPPGEEDESLDGRVTR